jgi:hypothetical protein
MNFILICDAVLVVFTLSLLPKLTTFESLLVLGPVILDILWLLKDKRQTPPRPQLNNNENN